MNHEHRNDDHLKHELLPALLSELERTRRRRTTRARIAAASTAAAVIALALIGAHLTLPGARTPPLITVNVATPAQPGYTIVRTDPSILERLSVRTDPAALIAATTPAPHSTTTVEILSDRQLLDLLTSVGRPAGLIRSGGRTWLTRDVTDPLPDSPG